MKKKLFIVLTLISLILLCFPISSYAAITDTDLHWSKNYVDAAIQSNIFKGTSTTTFSPDEPITRGQLIAVLARYAKIDLTQYKGNPFIDVDQNKYYYNAISWSWENEITVGYYPNIFKPDKSITREEVVTILNRYLKYADDGDITPYKDDAYISQYARDSVYQLTKAGIVTGYNGNFNPKQTMTRAEVAVIFCRLLGLKCEIYTPPLEYLGTFRLTYYCSACNSPRGSRATSSGAVATSGRTIAVPRAYYKALKGKTIYIENVGYRVVEDVCGTSAFDIFCDGGCSSQPLGCTYQKIYVLRR